MSKKIKEKNHSKFQPLVFLDERLCELFSLNSFYQTPYQIQIENEQENKVK